MTTPQGMLAPCPFCGEAASIAQFGTSLRSCIVICTECGCRHESGDVGANSGQSWNARHQGREALVAQFELLMRLADDLNVSDAAIGMRIRNLRTDFRSALTSAVREESKITGITAAELVADYLKLRCNSCDEGDHDGLR